MDRNELETVVRRIPVFRGFSDEQVQHVVDICDVTAFKAGDTVFNAGDASRHMLVVIDGILQVQAKQIKGEIATIQENGVVGEMGVLTGEARSATVTALRDTTALRVSRENLFELIESNHAIGYKIYRNFTTILCERLRENNILLEQQYLFLDALVNE